MKKRKQDVENEWFLQWIVLESDIESKTLDKI